MVSLEFFLDIILPTHYGPGVDSASNRNEYQEYFLGVKAAGAYGLQPYHLHVPIVLKSGSLNLLEPSGPVQACSGIALPFYHPNTKPEVVHRYYTAGLGTGTPEFEADACPCADSVFKFGPTEENRIIRHKCGTMVETQMQELEYAW